MALHALRTHMVCRIGTACTTAGNITPTPTTQGVN
jgi:hypothetical protein